MVANPAVKKGQLNKHARENEYFPVSVRARESGLARQVRPVPSLIPSWEHLLIVFICYLVY